MSNNIYDILKKMAGLEQPKTKKLNEGVYDIDNRSIGGDDNEIDRLEAAIKDPNHPERAFLMGKYGINKKSDLTKLPSIRNTAEKGYTDKRTQRDVDQAEKNRLSDEEDERDLERMRKFGGTPGMNEATKKAKPDYIDIDKDGDTEEPMKKAATDKQKSGLAEAIARVEARLMEKWNKETKTPEKEKGKYKNKTKAELERMLAAVKKSGPHKKGSDEYEKQNELEFAIRAKSGWGKVDESEANEEMLSPKQKKIAKAAPPPDKIDGKDFAALRKGKQVEEGFDDLQKYMKDKSEKTQHGTKTKTKTGVKHERDYDKEENEKETGEEKRGRGRPKKDKFQEDLEEGFEDLQKYMKEKEGKTQHGTKTKTKSGVKHERDYDKEQSTGIAGRPKKDKFAR